RSRFVDGFKRLIEHESELTRRKPAEMPKLEKLTELRGKVKAKRFEDGLRKIGALGFAKGKRGESALAGVHEGSSNLPCFAVAARPDPRWLCEPYGAHLYDPNLERTHRVLAPLDGSEAQREVFPQLARVMLEGPRMKDVREGLIAAAAERERRRRARDGELAARLLRIVHVSIFTIRGALGKKASNRLMEAEKSPYDDQHSDDHNDGKKIQYKASFYHGLRAHISAAVGDGVRSCRDREHERAACRKGDPNDRKARARADGE